MADFYSAWKRHATDRLLESPIYDYLASCFSIRCEENVTMKEVQIEVARSRLRKVNRLSWALRMCPWREWEDLYSILCSGSMLNLGQVAARKMFQA